MSKLTVLMPVYNASRFLRYAMDSVLTQSFTDFEFLIIDDASTDDSAAIIESYCDQRIRFVRSEQNLGISATLNKGIRLCNTALIARMDADDICYPSRLEKQYRFFENRPECALLSCWVRVVDEDGRELHTEKFRTEYYPYNLTFDCWMYHPSVVFKKDAVISVGGYSEKYAEDFDLFWKLSCRYFISNIEEVLLDYRVTSQSLHKVTKRKEYDEAMNRQLRRNVQYYCPGLSLRDEEINYLRFDFSGVQWPWNGASVVSTFIKLKMITGAILKKGNPSADAAAIEAAYRYRRRHLMMQLNELNLLTRTFIKFMLRLIGA